MVVSYSIPLLREFRRTIGQNIHRLRIEKRMPLRELAARTGIPLDLLDQFKLGKYEIRVDNLLQLSCALKVSVEELVADC